MTKESKEYENLIGEKVETGTFSLEELTGEKLVEVASEDWKDHWKGMPEFEQNQAHFKKLSVKFRNEEDYQKFADLVGQKLTPKTSGIWFPAPDGPLESVLYRWIEMKNKYPIYIVSKGRQETMLTSRALSRLKLSHNIVIEPQDEEKYEAALDHFKIRPWVRLLIAPFSNHGDGPGRARNWAWDHSIEEGYTTHWVMDDNIQEFWRLHKNKRSIVETGAIFPAMEDFCDRYENVMMAGRDISSSLPAARSILPTEQTTASTLAT